MAKLPKTSYITIQAFMINDLNLKGNELLLYALIYGFSQDMESKFQGSLSYMQRWLNVGSRNTVKRTIKRLEKRKLILKTKKKVNNITVYDYFVNPNTSKNAKRTCGDQSKIDHPCQKVTDPIKNWPPLSKSDTECQNLMGEVSKSDPHNIEDNIVHNDTEPLSNNSTLSIPSYNEVESYAIGLGEELFIDFDDFYWRNENRNWLDDKGHQIKNWKGLFNSWNKAKKQATLAEKAAASARKQSVRKKAADIKQREEELRKIRNAELKDKVNLSCPKCGRMYPDKALSFDVRANELYCSVCAHRWNAFILKKKDH